MSISPLRTPPPVPVEHTIDEYAKALLHIVIVVLAAVVVYLKSGNLTPTEYVNLAILLATSIGVYWTNLLPDAKFQSILKVGVAAAGAALAALNTFLIPGATINAGAIITIILAAAGALGVGVIPNASPSNAVYGFAGISAKAAVTTDALSGSTTFYSPSSPASSPSPVALVPPSTPPPAQPPTAA